MNRNINVYRELDKIVHKIRTYEDFEGVFHLSKIQLVLVVNQLTGYIHTLLSPNDRKELSEYEYLKVEKELLITLLADNELEKYYLGGENGKNNRNI